MGTIFSSLPFTRIFRLSYKGNSWYHPLLNRKCRLGDGFNVSRKQYKAKHPLGFGSTNVKCDETSIIVRFFSAINQQPHIAALLSQYVRECAGYGNVLLAVVHTSKSRRMNESIKLADGYKNWTAFVNKVPYSVRVEGDAVLYQVVRTMPVHTTVLWRRRCHSNVVAQLRVGTVSGAVRSCGTDVLSAALLHSMPSHKTCTVAARPRVF